MTTAGVRERIATARKFLHIAEAHLVSAEGESGPSADAQVAASTAVSAGIAAADVICGRRRGQRSNSQDHAEAVALLKTARPEGPALATAYSRLLSQKTLVQYGDWCTPRKAAEAVRRARLLVDALSGLGVG